MYDRRVALSPGIVIGCGIATAVVWLAALFIVADLSQSSLVIAGASGAVGAIGGGVGAIWQNWSQRHNVHSLAQVEHQAQHDNLTGLANRNSLFVELERASARAKKNDTVLGVLFLDLDRFKVINDSMGHEAGDELLRIVATRLKSAVRGSDMVARFGGDEFVVVCRDLLSERSVLAVAEQILKSFQQPVSLNGAAQVVSTSIGVAIALPADTRKPEDLVRDADAAMYRAKKSRSGYAVFDEAQRQQVMNRLDIGATSFEPRRGTARRLLPATRQRAAEAALRLRGAGPLEPPDCGLIGPGEFLGVAEETGMMARIGEMVLKEACAQAAVWNHLSPDARNIRMAGQHRRAATPRYPAAPTWPTSWPGVAAAPATRARDHRGRDRRSSRRPEDAAHRDLGVNLAIDDFGTGQSSLSYVKQFDMVTTLKIDKTFVDSMEQGTSNPLDHRGHHRHGQGARHEHRGRRCRERAPSSSGCSTWASTSCRATSSTSRSARR
ncbi:MAG: diguanylate cyclase [Acidimicrobiales bacterium]